MHIDKLEEKIERLKERISALNHTFKDEQLGSDAASAKEDAVTALEEYFDLVSEDVELEENSSSESAEDES